MAKFRTKFDSIKQDWETPDSIFQPLNREFGFSLDVCATKENSKCQRFFSPKEDGLSKQWTGICWMNPHKVLTGSRQMVSFLCHGGCGHVFIRI